MKKRFTIIVLLNAIASNAMEYSKEQKEQIMNFARLCFEDKVREFSNEQWQELRKFENELNAQPITRSNVNNQQQQSSVLKKKIGKRQAKKKQKVLSPNEKKMWQAFLKIDEAELRGKNNNLNDEVNK